jgi:voltage-gated potassium channel
MAASALRPIAVDFIDLLAGSDCEIEEFKVTENIDIINNFTSKTNIVINFSRRGEALLLATKVSGKLTGNPIDNFSISAGMIMIFLGSKEQLDRVRVRFKDVLVETS